MSPAHLLETFGTLGLLAIVFAETGLLVGFFLPGDSLLVLAGLFAALGRAAPVRLNLAVLLVGLPVAAIAGAQVGYLIGRRAGPALLRRPDSRLFRQEHVRRAQRFFDRYGGTTIVLARFVPVVRTLANPMAGVAGMPATAFAAFNVVGGLVWAVGITLLGFALGRTVPAARRDVGQIEAAIVLLSLVPVAVEAARARRRRRATRSSARGGP